MSSTTQTPTPRHFKDGRGNPFTNGRGSAKRFIERTKGNNPLDLNKPPRNGCFTSTKRTKDWGITSSKKIFGKPKVESLQKMNCLLESRNPVLESWANDIAALMVLGLSREQAIAMLPNPTSQPSQYDINHLNQRILVDDTDLAHAPVGTDAKAIIRPTGMARKKKCMTRTEGWNAECSCGYVSKSFMGRNSKKRARQLGRLHMRKCEEPDSVFRLDCEIYCSFQSGCSSKGVQTNN
jgi:hypothetical protein